MVDQHASAGDGELEAAAREGEATAMVGEEGESVKAQGEEAARQIKEAAQEEIDRRSTRLADGLDSIGRVMRLAAEDLDGEGQDWIADYTRRAAGQVERMTRYLQDEDAPAMLTDIEDLARRNPGTFLGASFAAGVVAGRFLRSSRPGRERDRRSDRDRASWTEGDGRSEGDAFDQVDRGPTIGGVHHESGMSTHSPGAVPSWDESSRPAEHERRR